MSFMTSSLCSSWYPGDCGGLRWKLSDWEDASEKEESQSGVWEPLGDVEIEGVLRRRPGVGPP